MTKKINKTALIIILFLVCFLGLKQAAFGQREIEDFLYQYEQYHVAYREFQINRDAYLQYKTLSSQNDAVSATKKLIIQRNYTLRTYFISLKYKLRNTPGVVGTEKHSQLVSLLDKEIIWLENENDQLDKLSTPTLEDLFIISDRSEQKNDYFKSLSYQSLSAVILGKVRDLQAESVALTKLLGDRIPQDDATSSAQLKEWLKEVENKNYASQKAIETAENSQNQIGQKQKEVAIVPLYNELVLSLKKGKKYFEEALMYQSEIYKNLPEN